MRVPRPILACLFIATSGCSSTETTRSDASDGPTDAVVRDVSFVDTVVPVDIVFGNPDAADGSGAPEDAATDAPAIVPVIGAHEGTVDRLRFAVFGDIRPPFPDQNSAYPQTIFGDVMQSIEETGVQFAVATGDYMNANFCSNCVDTQLDYLTNAERRFSGHVFHSLGNHECATVTAYNCDAENETVNIRTFRSRMLPDYAHSYYDWTIHTSNGDAHFIATAPNAWNSAQAAWLTTMLAQPATYTFVIAHEPPSDPGPGTSAIEDQLRVRAGGVSMRFYGHVHEYSRYGVNATVTGNAGAPLSGSSYYGFVVVEQREDGNLVVNAYEASHPPIVRDSFVVQPDGMAGR